jgi:hypothetical protein
MNQITASELYDRLVRQANDGRLTLQDDVTESGVQKWYDGLDIASRKNAADAAISRTVVTDLTAERIISGEPTTVADVISSHGDDPSEFNCAYIISEKRSLVQYAVPHIGGKEPMDEATAKAEMSEHATQMATGRLNSEIFIDAVQKFSE